MKVTKLISAMMISSVVGTSVFAAPTNTQVVVEGNPLVHTKEKALKNIKPEVDTNNTGYLNQDAYWMNIINRNQDNAYYVIQPVGNMKLSGIVAADFAYNSMRYGFSADPSAYKGGSRAALSVAELYYDAQVNPWTSLHFAATYDTDSSADNFSYGNDNTQPTISSSYGQTRLFFDEAYVFFNYNNLYMRVGRQFADFGSAMRATIAHSSAQLLSLMDETGITLGAMNPNGLYGDVFLYQGAPWGNVTNGDYSAVNRNGTQINGYTMTAGYVLNRGQNQFYGNDGLRTHIDYIANIADTMSMKWTLFVPTPANGTTPVSTINFPTSQVPGLSAHVDYTMGQWQVAADYVTALSKFNQAALAYGDAPAQPAAYSVAGTYSWNPTMRQGVTLGYDGSRQAVGVYPFTSGVNLPQNRMLLSYSIVPAKNVRVRVEYGYAKDYSESVGGTGSANNSLTTRIQMVF